MTSSQPFGVCVLAARRYEIIDIGHNFIAMHTN